MARSHGKQLFVSLIFTHWRVTLDAVVPARDKVTINRMIPTSSLVCYLSQVLALSRITAAASQALAFVIHTSSRCAKQKVIQRKYNLIKMQAIISAANHIGTFPQWYDCHPCVSHSYCFSTIDLARVRTTSLVHIIAQRAEGYLSRREVS